MDREPQDPTESPETQPEAAGPDHAPAESPAPRMSRRAAWLAMGAVIVALVLVWVVPDLLEQRHERVAEDAAEAALIGRPAPLHFTLKDMNGVNVKLESFRGKVILLNFWATWCGPCKQEIPWLIDLQKAHGSDLVVLGVSIDDTPELLKPYAAKMAMNYPVLVGLDREDVQDAYGPLFGIPVSVFIDRDGKVARRHSGIFASPEQMDQWIKALL